MADEHRRAWQIASMFGLDSDELEHEIAIALREHAELEREKCRGIVQEKLSLIKISYENHQRKAFLMNTIHVLEDVLKEI